MMELVDMLRLERSASCVQVQVLFLVPTYELKTMYLTTITPQLKKSLK